MLVGIKLSILAENMPKVSVVGIMTHGSPALGAAMLRHQQPEDAFLPSRLLLRCHGFPPYAPLQYSLSVTPKTASCHRASKRPETISETRVSFVRRFGASLRLFGTGERSANGGDTGF